MDSAGWLNCLGGACWPSQQAVWVWAPAYPGLLAPWRLATPRAHLLSACGHVAGNHRRSSASGGQGHARRRGFAGGAAGADAASPRPSAAAAGGVVGGGTTGCAATEVGRRRPPLAKNARMSASDLPVCGRDIERSWVFCCQTEQIPTRATRARAHDASRRRAARELTAAAPDPKPRPPSQQLLVVLCAAQASRELGVLAQDLRTRSGARTREARRCGGAFVRLSPAHRSTPTSMRLIFRSLSRWSASIPICKFGADQSAWKATSEVQNALAKEFCTAAWHSSRGGRRCSFTLDRPMCNAPEAAGGSNPDACHLLALDALRSMPLVQPSLRRSSV
jgi:hypothetical protein